MYASILGPHAIASIQGGRNAPHLSGEVQFFKKKYGVLVMARIFGLPKDNASGFFGFHIHAGTDCGGEDFANTAGHYNPGGKLHPSHAGDLPPLLSCNGSAYMTVMTDRFSVDEIIGRTVVIHDSPDDFRSQPAGNAGRKIACGVIRRV